MTDYTRTTIKLPQEVAVSLDQQLTRQHKVKIKTTLIYHIHVPLFLSQCSPVKRLQHRVHMSDEVNSFIGHCLALVAVANGVGL